MNSAEREIYEDSDPPDPRIVITALPRGTARERPHRPDQGHRKDLDCPVITQMREKEVLNHLTCTNKVYVMPRVLDGMKVVFHV